MEQLRLELGVQMYRDIVAEALTAIWAREGSPGGPAAQLDEASSTPGSPALPGSPQRKVLSPRLALAESQGVLARAIGFAHSVWGPGDAAGAPDSGGRGLDLMTKLRQLQVS